MGHFPDVDVRPEGVTGRTASGEYGALRFDLMVEGGWTARTNPDDAPARELGAMGLF